MRRGRNNPVTDLEKYKVLELKDVYTQNQIARILNRGQATISRIINNRTYVNDSTRKHLMKLGLLKRA